MIEPMLFFWKLYVDGNSNQANFNQGVSNQAEKSCLNINKPTIKVKNNNLKNYIAFNYERHSL